MYKSARDNRKTLLSQYLSKEVNHVNFIGILCYIYAIRRIERKLRTGFISCFHIPRFYLYCVYPEKGKKIISVLKLETEFIDLVAIKYLVLYRYICRKSNPK